MKTLGIDIGTTTISAVVVKDGHVLSCATHKNDSFISTGNDWERIQDPGYIRSKATETVEALLTKHPDIRRIGVTGQMHGILYLDSQGIPVSPLYTWQDGRGNLPFAGMTYARRLSQITGYPVSSGFGLVTHYYNVMNDLVPTSAAVFCTIQDYIAMVLAGASRPVTDASDGASFGLFNVKAGCFDEEAIKKAGMKCSILPALGTDSCIGFYREKIPVYTAIGDNQASFIGATGANRSCMLVNMGTGGQFSVFSEEYLSCPGLETRPFPGGFLLVGSSLCGGRAYALFEKFVRDTLSIAGMEIDSCYEALDALLGSSDKPENLPVTSPLFQGTRNDPTLRGSITGLDPENFTIRHLVWSLLEGMAKELHDLYLCYADQGGKPMKLIGSGNGLRKNVYLQRCFADVFRQPLTLSACTEEAAAGAAIYAGQKFI